MTRGIWVPILALALSPPFPTGSQVGPKDHASLEGSLGVPAMEAHGYKLKPVQGNFPSLCKAPFPPRLLKLQDGLHCSHNGSHHLDYATFSMCQASHQRLDAH